MYYAAGVLVLAWNNGRLYTLLGRDHYDTYSDFGGKCDPCDFDNQLFTASREMYEETCGCILDVTEIRELLKKCDCIQTLSYTEKPYYMYILVIKYDDQLCKRFDQIYNYISKVPKMLKYTEKKSIQWFLFDSVAKNQVCLRNIFTRTMSKHKNTILKIAYKYLTTNTTYNYGGPKV